MPAAKASIAIHFAQAKRTIFNWQLKLNKVGAWQTSQRRECHSQRATCQEAEAPK